MSDTRVQYEQKVGQLLLGLADKCDFIRIQTADSLLAKGLLTVKATNIRGKINCTITEQIRESDLVQFGDINVLIDSMVKRLDNEMKVQRNGV